MTDDIILHRKISFQTWLRQQRDRDDPIGDLARDYISDCRSHGVRRRSVSEVNFACDREVKPILSEALTEYAVLYL
jgi:hypothetical protein